MKRCSTPLIVRDLQTRLSQEKEVGKLSPADFKVYKATVTTQGSVVLDLVIESLEIDPDIWSVDIRERYKGNLVEKR